jgi:type IV pilus assembly protein PilW
MNRSKGFSLVEIMVGVVIGMLAVIIMMQVFALSEGRKRTSTGGGDAITGGVMALYAIQRDVRMSGYGIADTQLMGCGLTLPTGITLNPLTAVTINSASISGNDANTDTLLVVSGNTNGTTQGDLIANNPTATTYPVQTPSEFVTNDWVVATVSDPHILNNTARNACGTTLVMGKVTGVAASTVTVTAGSLRGVGDRVFNLGKSPTIVGYAIRGGNLTTCDFTVTNCQNAANWVAIENNIVSLRAQYGVDTSVPMDGIVDGYQQALPTASANNNCNLARISAVRIALVARSAQFEKTAVTSAEPIWSGSTGAAINVSANSTWQNYRYKVFETAIPLRNIAWMGVIAGC